MAQKGEQRKTFSCFICRDQLKDPVTIPCRHNYCMNCIKSFWDQEDEKQIHSCPLCRKSFTPRPALVKNATLAVVVEILQEPAPDDRCYAAPEDLAFDKHLQPHYNSAPLKKHNLVDPSKRLRENICSRHDEVMNMFCRTDQQFICSLCPVDEHKGHDTVSAAAERTGRQRELEVSRQNIQQRIQDRERDVQLLQQAVEAINRSVDEAVGNSVKMFAELIRLTEKRSSEVRQEVRSQQKTEVSRVKELQEELEQEITELKRRDAELVKLSHTEDHTQFLHSFASLSALSESTSSISLHPLRQFESVTAAVSEVRDKLQNVLSEMFDVDVLLSQLKAKTRAKFLKCFSNLTFDPNTAHTHLLLSEGGRKATKMSHKQPHPSHPDRFTKYCQVLSRESLTGRCYWEVEWQGGDACVAVAYSNIRRAGGSNECRFGYNDKSWALYCISGGNHFWHNNVHTPVSGPQSSRVGVYLDHSAGVLSFYSVSETMTLLHTVQTTFTQPLHHGLWIDFWSELSEVTAELCEPK
ncbi:E3 ubiquitin/ISG15 ligase TRIM25-like [Plectropomus leopardus]|uniref:E3 ubiquitin/ISG15 ligase TRIM25-like n=1 Tax=Plectropomus leopardus TaxID=160734 RepID=UPI001C4B79EC|nr:E3 ubiquitin/ISG15 ligase TRIM25-like [Plectropomus leopardus]